MPRPTPTISGEQRAAIYDLVVDHLSCIGDLPLAIRQEDFATARRLAHEFGQDLRLLEDLGWGPDARLEVALSMPPEELVDTFHRLHRDAKGALSESAEQRESREAEEAWKRRDELVLQTSAELLIELQGGEVRAR